MKYVDENTYASSPGGVHLSRKKLRELAALVNLSLAENRKLRRKCAMLDEYLLRGDTQPAIVLSTDPLCIAAYSDEFDAVVLLKFPPELAEKYGLHEGSRLTVINTYTMHSDYSPVGLGEVTEDITPGEGFLGRYLDFSPLVGLFLTDDTAKLIEHSAAVPNSLWEYVEKLGYEYAGKQKGKTRDGLAFLR